MIESFEEVVAHQVVPGRTTLADLGRLIDAPSWLGDEDVDPPQPGRLARLFRRK